MDIILYCRVGQRAYYALCILRQYGYDRVYNLSGGWLTYASAVLD